MSTKNGLRKNSASKTAVTRTPGGTTITPAANEHLADDPHLGIQEQQEVLTAEELGKILRIHAVTVRLKAAAGVIPGRQLGNRWRFSRARINEWLKAA
jgi:excisionase family DNA binding protein